jgi:hypothetical protein
VLPEQQQVEKAPIPGATINVQPAAAVAPAPVANAPVARPFRFVPEPESRTDKLIPQIPNVPTKAPSVSNTDDNKEVEDEEVKPKDQKQRKKPATKA